MQDGPFDLYLCVQQSMPEVAEGTQNEINAVLEGCSITAEVKKPEELPNAADAAGVRANYITGRRGDVPIAWILGEGPLAEPLPSTATFSHLTRRSQAASTPPNPTPQPESTPAGPSSTQTRFRTFSQAIQRLKWDRKHATDYYEVGYVDRLDGLMWKGLEDWQLAEEEEGFIPEHRVRQIRRKSDGFVVWDREKRRDSTDVVA
jgi:uncharacterized protein (UPF0248 family)